jgi:transcriptional regulator with XRE-family HTH domain
MTGAEFRKLRRSIGYSQAKVCKEMDVAPRTVTRWETGETPIPKMAVLALKYLIAMAAKKETR